MTRRAFTATTGIVAAVTLAIVADASAADLQPRTVQAWNMYVAATEARIATELRSPSGFLVTDFTADRHGVRDTIAGGAIAIGRLTTLDGAGNVIPVPDGHIAHWRGAVFLRGVPLDTLLNRLQHPTERGPHQQDVVALRVLDRRPDHVKLAIRIIAKNMVTATYDTEHVVDYQRYGNSRASARSVSTRIVEIENPGTSRERALPEGRDRGFLWRMNGYWRYEQVQGGVIVELESLTLSRSIPFALSAVVEPFIDRIARDSVNRTLDSIRRIYGAVKVARAALTYGSVRPASAIPRGTRVGAPRGTALTRRYGITTVTGGVGALLPHGFMATTLNV